MKKLFWMPIYFSLGGAILLLVLALVNLTSAGIGITPNKMVIPGMVGLVAGFLLGFARKKRFEKSIQLGLLAKELEKNLEEVKAQKVITENLQRLVESIPLPVYLKDHENRYLLANDQYESLSGKPRQEIIGKTDFEIFPDPIAGLFREQDQEVTALGRGKTFEETIPLPSGIVTFETFKFPLMDDEGNIYAVGGICTDITKLKEAEDSFASRQERLDVVLRYMDEAVIATNCDTRVVMFNQRAAELTGQESEIAIGRLLEKIYVPKDPETGGGVKLWLEKDGNRVPSEQGAREVILMTESGRVQPVRQKTILLLDRFGQNMGILILFRSSIGREASGRDAFGPGADIPTNDPKLSAEELQESAQSKPIKILIMDDDALVRKTCALMLATAGFNAVNAQNGQEAVDLYGQMMVSENPVRAVIMDLTVPGAMGGVEATTRILELDPQARIMVSSGYSNDPVLANFREYGFLARVEKPFNVEELLQAVRNLVAE